MKHWLIPEVETMRLELSRTFPFLLSAAALFLLLFGLGYRDTLQVLVSYWTGNASAGYTHGFLVVICSCYLLYLRRQQISALEFKPNYLALFPLLASSFLWFVSIAADIQLFQMAFIPVVILSAMVLPLGNGFMKIAFIPVFILFFAIPIWQPVLPILQDITTMVSHTVIKLIGRPVYVQGNNVLLPGGAFIIEESCSGLRFLLVSVILTMINSYMNQHTYRQGAILFMCISALAFLANWVRVVAILLIGDYTQMQSSLVEDHANFGWMIYLFLTLIPYLLISRLIKPSVPEHNFSDSNGAAVFPAATVGAFFVMIFAMMTGPALDLAYGQPGQQETSRIYPPAATLPWRRDMASGGQAVSWKPQYNGASQEISANYENLSGNRVFLRIVYYARQEQGAELINVNNSLVDGANWTLSAGPVREEIQGSGGMPEVLSAEIVSRRGQRVKVWYWYYVGGKSTTGNIEAKLLQVASLFQDRADAGLVTLAVPCDDTCVNAATVLQDFVNDMAASIQAVMSP